MIDIIYSNKNDKMFKNMLKYIRAYSGELCSRNINSSYLTYHSFKLCDHLFVALDIETKTRSKKGLITLYGFVLIQELNDELYIDVICSKGYGKKLLQHVDELANYLNKKYITLNALPQVINFYKKLGFVHAEKQCYHKTKIIENMSNHLKNKKFKSHNNSVIDKEFKFLLKVLMHEKLTGNKSCKSLKECSLDGFKMTKCV